MIIKRGAFCRDVIFIDAERASASGRDRGAATPAVVTDRRWEEGLRRTGGWGGEGVGRGSTYCAAVGVSVGRSTGVVSQAPPAFPRARQHPLVLPLALRFSPPLSLPVVPFYTRCHRLRRRLYFDCTRPTLQTRAPYAKKYRVHSPSEFDNIYFPCSAHHSMRV